MNRACTGFAPAVCCELGTETETGTEMKTETGTEMETETKTETETTTAIESNRS